MIQKTAATGGQPGHLSAQNRERFWEKSGQDLSPVGTFPALNTLPQDGTWFSMLDLTLSLGNASGLRINGGT
jgi:hypothetical protein